MAVANQYGIDMGGIQQGWSNSLRDMLVQRQVQAADREAEGQKVLGEYGPAAMGGDREAMGKVFSANPTAGSALMTHLAKMNKDDRERTMKEAPIVARMLGGVKDQESYSRAMEGLSAAGINIKSAPMQYDPKWANTHLTAARAMTSPDFHFAESANGPVAINKETLTATPIQGVQPKPDTEIEKLLAFKNRLKPDDPYRKVVDDAILKATTPSSLLTLEQDGNGGMRLEVGGKGGAGSGLQKPTLNKIEESVLNSSSQLARLSQIERGYRPEYQQIATRGQNWWNSVKAKAGADLDQQSRQELQDYTAYRRDTIENTNQTIKDITGAAMSIPEAERIMQQIPNAGTGVFDGDSPPEFEAKLKGAISATRNAIIRSNWARARGMDPLKTGVELSEVPKMIDKRGVEVEKLVRAQNPKADDQAVKEAVRLQLGKEFGFTK